MNARLPIYASTSPSQLRRVPDWTDAACTGKGHLFFRPTADPRNEWNPAAAIAICGRCPLLQTCRDYAIQQRIEYGVWGGTTGNQRRAMLGLPSHPECGTPAAYRAHKKAKEEPCGACRTAYLDYRTVLRNQTRGRGSVRT